MKQEAGKKKMKWLIPVIIVALLLVGGGVAWFMLSDNNNSAAQPQETVDPSTSGQEIMGRADIYWNLDRKAFIDPATSLSIREPAEDGLYHMMFAFDGEQVELTVADKKLVNRIDMLDFMGLEVDEGGNVTNCFAPGEVCTIAAENFFVQSQTETTVKVNSSGALNGMEIDYAITENTGIYNVSDLAEVRGAVDTVQPMDKVVVLQDGAGETTHIFIVERPQESYVYWRVGQYYANKETTRKPDENGVYHILFAVNGEQVTLPCKDKDIVTKIDAVDNNIQAMGLIFDDEGYIIDTMTSAMAIRGALVSNQFDVVEISGTFFKTQRMLPSSNQGATWEGVMSETCKIYEVSGTADFVGQEVEDLRVTDRVYVLVNTNQEAEIIFITNRMLPDHDLYWLATRYYDNAAQTTTLKPADDGYWYMDFVIHGDLVTLRSNDLNIVNQVQAPTTKAMGLDLDGDVITKVYHYVNITGGWVVAGSSYVDAVNGPIVNTSYASGSTNTFVMSADCEVMNVCFSSPDVMGEYTTLQVGDRVVPLRNAAGEVVVVYVNQRKVDSPVYWSLSRSYNSTKKETTRKPLTTGDWAGYYEFKVTTDGNRYTRVYTKSKEIATQMDAKYPQYFGLKLSGKVVTKVYDGAACTGGSAMANYCHVEYWENEQPDENGISRFYAKYRATGNGTTVQFNEDTKIYNVSASASYVGEQVSSFRLDDRIAVLTDRFNVAQIIFIVERPIYDEPYYNIQQMYSSSKGETTRQPNEEGYYVFDKVVYKGKLITVKTKSKDVASEVDSFGIGLGMHVYNGIVTRGFSIPNLANYGNNIGPNYDITAINGRELTLTRMRPSASNQGDEVKVTLTSSCKFYDVSSYAEVPGAVVTPQIGDRVVIYRDDDSKYGAIGFITMRHNREGGAYGYCDHCDQEVYWNHWEGSFPANANKEKDNDTTHYFVASDRQLSTQVVAGNEKQTVMHVVLDLNGKTLESQQRALGAWYGATLYVMDSSKDQTGTVIGRGAKVDLEQKPKGDGAGVALTTRGGSITIYGGNWKVAEDHNPISNGGIVNAFSHPDFKGGTITINGGKFYGTNVTENGGAVSCNSGEIVINGGEFFGGEAGNIGGTLHSATKLVLNGGIVHGGKANYGATLSMPNLVMNGGTVEAGEAKNLGDCMYISSTFKAEINGGTVADIWINSTWNQEKAYVKLSGTPTVKNIDIAQGKLIDATGLTGGSISVNATGVFTTEFASEAAAQAALKYFTSSSEMATVGVEGKQLTMGVYRCLYGHSAKDHETVKCDSEILTWSLWTEAGKLPTTTGNYILTKDVTTVNQTSIGGEDVVIDLNGFDITYQIPTARTQNFRLFYINDNQHKNGKEAGTKHGSLIITDNSTDDVTKQGTVSSILPAYAANYADEPKWKEEGAKYAESLGLTAGTAEYDAAVAEYIEKLLEGYKNTHDAGASGMLVHVAHGNFTLMGGNLDASNLSVKATGTAIATGTRLETMNADAQVVTILGGTVTAGTTTRSGGAISIAAGTELKMLGGTVNGGTLNGEAAHGAAIFGFGTMTVSGGTVNGGTGATNSGSIYAEGDAAVVTIDGTAVVNAGKATNGDNMYIRFGTWTIGGKAKINGGVAVSKASLTVTGAPTIVKATGGSEYSLKLATTDKLITFTDLADGAKIAITGTGKFSTVGDEATYQQWINKGYFVAEAEGKTVVIQGGQLSVASADAVDKVYCVYGHLNHDGIECSEPLLTWSKWEDTTKLPSASGNYYLADNSTLTTTTNLNIITTEDVQINLDLRGSTVLAPNKENARLLLVRASNESCYTITDTLAGGTIKSTASKLGTSMSGDLFFCYNGTIRAINIALDATSITENANQGSAVYVENYNGYIGSFIAENCTITGGNAKNGEAVAANTGCAVILKNTTVIGGYYQNASAKNVQLVGDTKLLPGTYANYGVTGTVAAAEFKCQELGSGAEIIAANCTYGFADEAAAQAAVDNGNIKPAEGYILVVSGKTVKVQPKPETYCVYGHESHEGMDCTEELLTWTKWEDMTKLPSTAGNYYVPAGSTITTTTNLNVITDSTATQINLDLRGSTVLAPNKADARMLLVRVANGGAYTITSTEGQAKIKTTTTSMNSGSLNGALFYCYNGLVRVINTDLDASSITTNENVASVAYTVNYNGYIGHFAAENSTITGGKAKNDDAITNSPACTTTLDNVTITGAIINQASNGAAGTVTITDSTVKGEVKNDLYTKDGVTTNAILMATNTKFEAKVANTAVASFTDCEIAELYHNTTGANLALAGVVKIPNMYTGHEDCSIVCNNLAAGSEIVASKGIYKFADATAAQAAVDNGVLKAATDFTLKSVNDGTSWKVIENVVERTQYCVYGHEKHEGETASCTEPILTWTKWEETTKLPTTAGNYYVPAGSTLNLSTYYNVISTEAVQINLDLRGSTVKTSGNAANRMLLVRTAVGGGYTITSTGGTQAKLQTIAAELSGSGDVNGGLLYCYQGVVRVINTDLDASSVTTNNNVGSAVYVQSNANYVGTFIAENSTITGGNAKFGDAIYNNCYYNAGDGSNTPGTVTLIDTTVYGGVYQFTSAKNTKFAGNTKVLPNTYAKYGVQGTNEAAEFKCTELGANAQLTVFNCNYKFADAAAAQTAVDNGNIVAAAGRALKVNGAVVSAVEAEVTQYCINGHTSTTECQAEGCTETIQTWTKLDPETTKILPKVAGYYYFPAGSTVNLDTQINTDANSGDIFFDLRGSTVNQTKQDVRIMLVNGNANVTFLDTVGGGKLVYTADSSTMEGMVLYAHTGTLTVRDGITVDSTAVTTANEKAGGALYVNTNGTVNLDGVTVKGGVSKYGAIYHQGVALNLKDTTVETAGEGTGSAIYAKKPIVLENCTVSGAVYNYGSTLTVDGGTVAEVLHNGGQANLTLKGDVKIAHMELVNAEGWGKTDSLGVGAEVTIANASWGPFADLAAAQAAIDNGLLKPAAGTALRAYADGTTGRVFAEPVRCIYGHIAHEGETADCAEPIVQWTLAYSTSTRLPSTSGNYYFKDGAEVKLTSQTDTVKPSEVLEIRVDLRGAKVTAQNDARVVMLKGAAGSFYTITDTKGGASIKTTKTSSAIDGGAAMLYANIGEIRAIGVEIDSTSITTNTQQNSVATVLATGKLTLENCTVKGGASSNGVAIYHNPASDASVKNLVIKNTTVEGCVHVNGSALCVKLEGVVKLLPGANGTIGLQGSADAAEFDCTKLEAGSEIVAANCNYSFGTPEAATAANGTIIKPATGKTITIKNDGGGNATVLDVS